MSFPVTNKKAMGASTPSSIISGDNNDDYFSDLVYNPSSSYFDMSSSRKPKLVPIETRKEGSDDDDAKIVLLKPKGWGKRHTMTLMGFLGILLCYAMRVNLSIAMMSMVKHRVKDSEMNGTDKIAGCNAPVDDAESENRAPAHLEGEFEWNSQSVALVTGAFFWGYLPAQIPGGLLVAKYGGKLPFGLAVFISALMSSVIPVCARINPAMIMYCRLIQGVAQGATFPGIQSILAAWCPPRERSTLTGIVFSGCQFGAALSMIVSGYLSASILGWPSAFYGPAILGVIWFFLWIKLVENSPSTHSTISTEERDFIIDSIGEQASKSITPPKTPWRALLSCRTVWVLGLSQMCNDYGIYSLLNELPLYLKKVLHYGIEANSWFSAAPSIAMWFVSPLSTFVADFVINKNWASRLRVRKSAHLIAELGMASFFIWTAFVGCNRDLAVVLIIIATGFAGATCASYIPNMQEIACNHTAVVVGVANTMANFPGIFMSIVSENVTKHSSNPADWEAFFFILAGFNVASAVIYTLFASVKEEPWNREDVPVTGGLLDEDAQQTLTPEQLRLQQMVASAADDSDYA